MGCKEIRNKLSDYSEEAEMTEEMRSHLSSCAACHHTWQYVRKIESLIKSEREEAISPFFMTRLEAAIESNYQQESRFYNVLKPKIAALIVVAGMLIGGILPLAFQESYERKVESPNEEFLFFELTVEPNELNLLNELS